MSCDKKCYDDASAVADAKVEVAAQQAEMDRLTQDNETLREENRILTNINNAGEGLIKGLECEINNLANAVTEYATVDTLIAADKAQIRETQIEQQANEERMEINSAQIVANTEAWNAAKAARDAAQAIVDNPPQICFISCSGPR